MKRMSLGSHRKEAGMQQITQENATQKAVDKTKEQQIIEKIADEKTNLDSTR